MGAKSGQKPEDRGSGDDRRRIRNIVAGCVGCPDIPRIHRFPCRISRGNYGNAFLSRPCSRSVFQIRSSQAMT